MYPLNMHNGKGYAVANTEDEHKSLSEAGYKPELSLAKPEDKEDPPKRKPGRPPKAP